MKSTNLPNTYEYFSRDISWLSFNYRVLQEAKDETLPLFDRLKFLSIYSSNLEEFFRVRVSEHRKKLIDKVQSDEERLQAQQILDRICEEVARQVMEYDHFFENDILEELAKNKIVLYRGGKVESFHQQYVETYFLEEVFPYLTPVLILPGEIRSFIRDNRLYILVKVKSDKDAEVRYFYLKVPYSKVPRFIELPQREDFYYLMFSEDLIKANLAYLFPGFTVEGAYTMRVSRDADFFLLSESPCNLEEDIKRHVRKRKIGVANRLVYESSMAKEDLNYLCGAFGFDRNRCIAEGSHLHLEDLIKLPNPIGVSLVETLPEPVRVPLLDQANSMFEVIESRDVMLHFPYQSFDYFLRLLSESAFDPHVMAIKVTQYRVAANSAVINKLITAARNGKKVTVYVELKARFDEENNLQTAERMRQAGIQIVYSTPGLKVHAKMLLIERDALPAIACLSTGNFNEKTAGVYSDIVVLTSHVGITRDMMDLFVVLETGVREVAFQHILVAQINMQEQIYALIDAEIAEAKAGRLARILLKMNGLQDVGMINKLYEASMHGVEIDLIVRGICCLVPEMPFSENIRITRIVDSYLEHSRLWYFHAGGEVKVFITSADWMKRNLSRRIETAFPIYDPIVKAQVVHYLLLQLRDNQKACWVTKELQNVRKQKSEDELEVRCQREMFEILK